MTKDIKYALSIYKVITNELVDNLNRMFKKVQDELVKQNLTDENYHDYHVCCYDKHDNVIYEYTPQHDGSIELLYEDGYISICLPSTNVEHLLKYMSIYELNMFNTITKATIDVYSGKSKTQTVIDL